MDPNASVLTNFFDLVITAAFMCALVLLSMSPVFLARFIHRHSRSFGTKFSLRALILLMTISALVAGLFRALNPNLPAELSPRGIDQASVFCSGAGYGVIATGFMLLSYNLKAHHDPRRQALGCLPTAVAVLFMFLVSRSIVFLFMLSI